MKKALWPAIALIALLLPSAAFGLGPGTIEGKVTAPGPVGEVEVCAVEAEPSEACTYPAADGSYRLTGLGLGPQRVEFLPSSRSHFLVQYYNGKSSLTEAVTISLTPTSPTATGIDAHLELGGVIEGRVTAALGGDPLAGVEACAMLAGTKVVAGCAETDANGEYSIPGLGRNFYKVGFWGEGPSAVYMPRFYPDAPSFALATPVAVTPGVTQGGVDVQLSEGARVTGTVTESVGGQPLAGIAVCLLRAGDAALERCAATDGSGEYALSGIVSDSYEIVFSPEFSEFSAEAPALPEGDGYRTQYYDETPGRIDATVLALIAPEVRNGVDASLVSSRVIPPTPVPPGASALVPAPPVFVESPPKRSKKCKRGYRKSMVKGRVRCIKTHRRKAKIKHRSGD